MLCLSQREEFVWKVKYIWGIWSHFAINHKSYLAISTPSVKRDKKLSLSAISVGKYMHYSLVIISKVIYAGSIQNFMS